MSQNSAVASWLVQHLPFSLRYHVATLMLQTKLTWSVSFDSVGNLRVQYAFIYLLLNRAWSTNKTSLIARCNAMHQQTNRTNKWNELWAGLLTILFKSIVDIRYQYWLQKYHRYRYQYRTDKVLMSKSILRYTSISILVITLFANILSAHEIRRRRGVV